MKPISLGLIATGDGSVMSRGEDQSRSPLQVNMRRNVISPHIIDLVAKVLNDRYFLWRISYGRELQRDR